MTVTALLETYAPDVDYVDEGSVVDSTGKRLRLSTLIKRRWGWGRRAADDAAELLRAQANGQAVRLWLDGPRRAAQQKELFDVDPGLVWAIMEGLSLGGQRVAGDDRELTALHVLFDDLTPDHGLVADVVAVLAQHLGVSAQELRDQRADFQWEANGPHELTVEVQVDDG